jgi:hypothetical protein
LLKSRASGGLWSSDLVKWAIALDPKEADRLQLSILASEGHGGIAIACAPTPSPARPRPRLRAHALERDHRIAEQAIELQKLRKQLGKP